MAKTAIDQNETRRAVKARQQARKSGEAAAKVTKDGTIHWLVAKERDEEYRREKIRQERRAAAAEHNGKRLLFQAIQGTLRIHADSEFYRRDVTDVKNAAKASKSQFEWRYLDSGDFIIGLRQKPKVA